MAVKAQDLTKDYKYGFHDADDYAFKSQRGLNREVVENHMDHLASMRGHGLVHAVDLKGG